MFARNNNNAQKIYLSGEEDERLLIPSAKTLRSIEAADELEKAPRCAIFLNSRIGSYIIAALQIAYGFFHLLICMAYAGQDEFEDEIPEDIEQSFAGRIYWGSLVSIYAIISGLLTFHALSYQRGRLLKPAIFLYLFGIFTFVAQLLVIIIYWDAVANKLREYLTYYCNDVEQILEEEIKIDARLQLNDVQDQDDLRVWKQFEYMITDDETWNQATKGYLMTLMSAILMVNTTVCSWFCWTLVAHMTWMSKKKQY